MELIQALIPYIPDIVTLAVILFAPASYATYSFNKTQVMARKKLEVESSTSEYEKAAARAKFLRETAYDAAAFAVEQNAKAVKQGNPQLNKLDIAVAYILANGATSDSEEAARAVESILGKISGVGASGLEKI